MASIVERTISSLADKRLSLTDEQAGRVLNIGTSWTQIRIGVRWSVDTAASSLTIPFFYVGMTSGTGSLPGDLTTDHFLGAGVPSTLALTNSHANGLYSGSGTTNFPRWHIQNGVATSSTTGTGGAASFVGFRSSVGWGMCMLDITKNSSTSFQVKGQRWFTLTSCTAAMFQTAMATGADTSNLRIGCDHAVTVDETTYGALDTFALSWGHETVAMEISDVDVRVIL